MAKLVKALETPDLDQPFSTELLGLAIKAKRTQSRITQSDAAELCGIAKQTYIKIEQGKGDIRMSSIMDVIQGLGIKLTITPWLNVSNNMDNSRSDDNDNWV
ncbi:transcriptional regulator [Photobacterium frigidiphilum]|uniref:Transcriptional regulator n=1 Tax=Photobacterium frigidiphilum TaxID=264736 RepID=A0A2T3J5Y3_9GAMM|nr:helix-turn-helix domain-containing protein [Photobacterium frigidiphilum]PSU42130.1 transcriptional regulator [Photobacterium frigidiphilum]